MLLNSRRAPRFACAVLFLAIGLLGWVARATLAQTPSKGPETPHPETMRLTAPPLPQDLNVPKVDPVRAAGAQSIAEPPSEPVIIQAAGDESEDPEKAAAVFVEQNLKLAESHLVTLRAEEARLRAAAEGRSRNQALGNVDRCPQAEPGNRLGSHPGAARALEANRP